ncbi:hypothetical protein GGS23DRAFT_82027 [Durotheca rogersii]|uniref:uncharacterized protein n=1 Tax=Durotheca rogersii TaxID=419775 RepID=UPI00221FCA03|nr:uncharacterized protein GGS23DRAFT_82027 [Durotheca rogersii]KAI5862563.1 hypothetical protein GGS23DRAFT_82027 [Durotheca rogersii]
MRPDFSSESVGQNPTPTANLDEPCETSEWQGRAAAPDASSPSQSVKVESRSPSAGLSRYHGVLGSSPVSPEKCSVGADSSSTAGYDRDSDLSSPASSAHGPLPILHRNPKSSSSPDECHTHKVSASAEVQSAEQKQSSRGKQTRHHLQPAVWERYKDDIHDLYIEQNKPLSELMEIMSGKGFKATPRMYKAKFAQWGFVKNNKQKDVAMMLRLQRQRNAAGKPTTFRRHGRSIDIETYMKRKGISNIELAVPALEVELPEYLRALTPPPAEPQHMTLPSHLHAQDILVSCYKNLTSSWRDSIVSAASFEEDFNIYFDGALCEATRDFSRACWFFSRGHNSHGALLSQRAFSSLHLLIKAPSALGLFDLLIASVISPDYGLVKELWKYLAAYADATLGPWSTLCRLFTALDEVFRTNTLETGVDFIFSCMESILGMLLETGDFAQTIAPSLSFFLLGDLILFDSTRTNLPSLQRAVASVSTILSSLPQGYSDAPSVMRFVEPAAYLWQHGPYDEHSAQLAYASLQLADDASNRYDWIYWVSWRVIARFHRSRCGDAEGAAAAMNPRHALARYALGKAVDAAQAGRGFNESQIFDDMATLEAWHREAGDTTQQLAVHRRREDGLRDYFEELRGGIGHEELPRTPNSP